MSFHIRRFRERLSMSMTTDADHQAMDLNIGRIIEMYLMAEITLPLAKADILKLFGHSHTAETVTDLEIYLSQMLEQLRMGDLEPAEVRADLIRLLALANAHDPDFLAQVRRDPREMGS